MAGRERSDEGTFVEWVTLDAVLGVFEEVRGPVITSSDVAEQLDCTTEAARQKLRRLHERGDVERRKTGRTVVWWLAEPSSVSEDGDETGDQQEQTATVEDDGREDEMKLDADLVERVRREL
jgi:predicted ArsR family transcriptional regulator